MNAPETALQGKDTGATGELYMAFELSDTKWILCLSDGRVHRAGTRWTAGDGPGCWGPLRRPRSAAAGGRVRVNSCYEAGRDGFWLHRWLLEQGIDNVVVDSSSIEVNRRARRAKSDGLDAAKLYEMLVRYHGGETRVWRVVRVPTVEQEDARRLHRELERLKKERNAHGRMRSWRCCTTCAWSALAGAAGAAGGAAGAAARGAVAGDRAREPAPGAGEHPDRGAGAAQGHGGVPAGRPRGAADAAARHRGAKRLGAGARAVWLAPLWQSPRAGRLRGSEPQPLSSGDEHRQGISKAGNKRVRELLVEIAWYWLRYQPHSALSQWFDQRFAQRGQAHAPHRHRGAGQAPAGGAVALPRAWGDPRRGTAQARGAG